MRNYKKKIILCIIAFLLTAAGETLGRALTLLKAETETNLKTAITAALPEGVLWGFGACLLCIAVYYFMKEECFAERPVRVRGVLLASFLVILIAWIPCWLAYYPANYSYDGEPQLIQYTTGAFDNHHPIFHTLILGGCYSLGQFLRARGIPVDGMAIYSALQSVVLALALAGVVRFAVKKGATWIGTVLLVLFFAIFPMHPLMAVTTTKDTLFTAFLLFFLLRLAECLFPEDRTKALVNDLFLLADAVLMMLFRKNGFYITLLLVLVLLAAAVIKEVRRVQFRVSLFARTSVALLAALVLFTAAEYGLKTVTGAKEGEAGEMLSLPLQQIARTYKSNGNQLTEEELAEITKYISEDGMNQYRPFVSDGVKQNFDNDAFREDPEGFFRIWLKLFKEYPGSYGMAFLYQTMGAWFPDDVSHTEVYKDWWRDRVCYFVTDATPVFTGYDFVEQQNLLPAVRSFYENIVTELSYRESVGARILFSPYFWCSGALLLPLVLLLKKRRRAFLVSVPVLGEWIFIYLGPCVISRYIYPFMAALPILVVLCFEGSMGICKPLCSETPDEGGKTPQYNGETKELQQDIPPSIIKENVPE